MIYQFGARSRERLRDCDLVIVQAGEIVLRYMDITVQANGGQRTAATQNWLYREGRSTKDGFQDLSKHQELPSQAVDFAPYPIDWHDLPRWYYMGGLFRMAGEVLGVELRWGGDWDGDGEIGDQNLHDLGHVELKI